MTIEKRDFNFFLLLLDFSIGVFEPLTEMICNKNKQIF